ncbi:MAG: pyruvate kinase, partial [Psychroflexus halocasei]
MKTSKKTKIVSTLGPSTSSRETLKAMIEKGVNIFRINFSHASYDDVKERVKMIRQLNEEYGFNVGILGDLQGPKLRVGKMKDEVVVSEGDEIYFVTGEEFEGTNKRVYMNYETFPRDVQKGESILLDDGKLIFEVVSTNKTNEVKAKVIQGGPLRSRKGVNLPNTKISLPALTEKDIKDAIFACELEVDWMALSFVRYASDLKTLQKLIKEHS